MCLSIGGTIRIAKETIQKPIDSYEVLIYTDPQTGEVVVKVRQKVLKK